MATPNPSFDIPVVDFSNFHTGTSPTKRQIADQILGAFKTSGFVYLSNHGIPAEMISDVFQKSAQFFQLPKDVKETLAWKDPHDNRGYIKTSREKLSLSFDVIEIDALRVTAPDYKETMEIGRDWNSVWKNRWPEETDVPGFRQAMLAFYQSCHEFHVSVMRAIALGLELEESFFDDKFDQQFHDLRLLHYLPVKRALLQGTGERAGAHSDYGGITFLFQDSVGGLQAQNPDTGVFHFVPPVRGTIVVNAGDLLARWSNDTVRSTVHRVVAPTAEPTGDAEEFTPSRQSIAFFCYPNPDVEISCLPNCSGPGRKPKYEPVMAEEYIGGRFAATIVH